jgi:hypothetical protein
MCEDLNYRPTAKFIIVREFLERRSRRVCPPFATFSDFCLLFMGFKWVVVVLLMLVILLFHWQDSSGQNPFSTLKNDCNALTFLVKNVSSLWEFGGSVFDDVVQTGQYVCLWIKAPNSTNPPPRIRVIFRSERAIFAPRFHQGKDQSRYISTFFFPFAGSYSMELVEDSNQFVRLLDFVVSVSGHFNSANWFPTSVCGLSSARKGGIWLNCKFLSQESVCRGNDWIWITSDCYYEINQNFRALEGKWITFLGDSRTRGLFLYFVSSLISNADRHLITSSHFWKTWGILDFRIGNTRFTWRDVRLDASLKENRTKVGEDLKKVLTDEFGNPDFIVTQNGLDIVNRHFDHKTVVFLEGWEFLWESPGKGVKMTNSIFDPKSSEFFVETFEIMLPMYRELCTEYPTHSIHMHTCCGTKLVGVINEMTSKIILSLLVRRSTVRKAVNQLKKRVEFCWAGTDNYDPHYSYKLPNISCSSSLSQIRKLAPCDRKLWNGCSKRSYIFQMK